MKNRTVAVIGMGYIGLPTALMMASHGINVVGVDYNEQLINTLNAGKTTFKEKGLDELFDSAVNSGIVFTTKYPVTDLYIVSVPTPYDKESKKIDPLYVVKAVETVLSVCSDNSIIVVESTISPGTIDKFIRPIVKNQQKHIELVHAPERIIPGNMVYELLNNNRTIGSDSKEIGELVKSYYSSFCKGEIVITDIKTAEMTKVVENTFRAVNIAFANELAKICDSDGMNVYEIIKICNMHPRVNILQPGPGVGGHCISVDPWFLVGDYPDLTKVIGASMDVNASMPTYVINKMSDIIKENNLDINRIGIYGLTYKENVDDVRESPTLQLLEHQEIEMVRKLKAFDPWVEKSIVNNQYHDFDKFLDNVDAVIVMAKHKHIIDNVSKIRNKIIFDTCNIINDETIKKYKL